jgi:hypothetical protein
MELGKRPSITVRINPLQFLNSLPIEEVSEKTHYRLKICVSFQKKLFYTDVITNPYLLEKINNCLSFKRDEKITYGYFQRSNYTNDYSIILSCHIDTDPILIKKLYRYLIGDNDLKVFGYFLGSNKNNITYLSKNKTLEYKYYDFIWHTSPNSFIQVNPGASKYIHETVEKLINPKCYFCAIGGEMGVYVKAFEKKKFKCLTNSRDIYNDCILNCQTEKGFYLVDYSRVDLKKYMRHENMSLVVNISRSGLQNLADQIVNIPFKQIIYIACCDKTVIKDISILKQAYKIDQIIKIDQFPTIKKQDNPQYSYIINLIKPR